MADAETLIECVICFDSIAQAEPLPCRCTVPYCMKCWDRSLAQSFNACGQARCPTCRSPVRVDFDAEANDGRGRLVFSKEPADHSYEQEESELADGGGASPAAAAAAAEAPASIRRAEVVERLAEQAAPVMARLLGEWGAAHPSLRAMAREPAAVLRSSPVKALKEALAALGGDATACVDKADLIAALEEAAGGRAPLAAYWTMAEATAAATAAEIRRRPPVPPPAAGRPTQPHGRCRRGACAAAIWCGCRGVSARAASCSRCSRGSSTRRRTWSRWSTRTSTR